MISFLRTRNCRLSAAEDTVIEKEDRARGAGRDGSWRGVSESIIASIILFCFLFSAFSTVAQPVASGTLPGNPPTETIHGQEKVHRVFILNSFNIGYRWTDNMLRGIKDTFQESGLEIEPYTVFMDMKHIRSSEEYYAQFRELLRTGYAGIAFDVVLACDNDALNFLRQNRDDLFPGAPVVFVSINDFNDSMLNGRTDITGTSENTDYQGTISVALSLRPTTKTIAVVIDDTITGRAHRSAVEKIAPHFSERIKFQYLSLGDSTLEEIGQTLAALGKDSIVLLLHHFIDKNGISYSVEQSTPFLTSRCSAPCFAVADIRVGLGALGGNVVSGYHHGQAAASMAAAILKGTPIGSLPVLLESPNKCMFDYRVMRRFEISELALPKGSIIINKPPSIIEQYRKDVLGVAAAFAVTFLLLVLMLMEILRRRRAEKALRASEMFNRNLVAHLPQSIFVKDRDSRYISCNANYAQGLGITPEQVVGKDDFEFHPSEMAEIYRSDDRSTMAEGAAKDFEERYYLAGEERWAHTIKLPYRDDQGRIIGVLGIFEDITERKRADEALRHSEDRLRAVLDATPFPIAVVDLQDDKIHFWSRSALSLFGHVASTASEWYQIAYPDPDYRREVIERWKPFLEIARRTQQSVNTGEYHIACSDGSFRICELYAAFLADCLVVTFNDVTERKHAEEALRTSEKRLVLAQRSAGAGVWDWDMLTGRLYWSDELFVLFGLNPEQDEASFEVWRGIIHPEDAAAASARVDRAVSTGAMLVNEYRIVLPDDQTRWINALGDTTYDQTGRPIRMAGICIDITERKRLEEQLRQAQKLEAVGQLAGGVAHDFNNILQIILVSTQLIQNEIAAGTPAKDTINEIESAARRAADLVRQLLAFSRRQLIQPVNVHLNHLIEGVFKMVRRVIGEHITLQFVPGHLYESVFVDVGQIEQVVMNLCVNARDAMACGGTLTIETGSANFDAAYCRDHAWASEGSYVRLSVSDTGHGMDKETVAHIFEPFFTTKGIGEGSGLGLAMVYGIVKQHKGLVNVRSELGKGTVFNVYLPAAGEMVEAEKVPEVSVVKGGTETILIAEDEPAVLKMVATVLRNAGYNVLTAGDGNEALRVFDAHADAIDLVLLDVMMPGLGGRQVMDEIRTKKTGVSFLFSSGYSKTAIHTDFVIHEGLRLIQKPYSKEVLLREVRTILDARVMDTQT